MNPRGVTSDLDRDSPAFGRPEAALRFPPGFLWGTATSATQVEGHVTNEWTDYVAPDGGRCHRACDHFHRYREDIRWMQALGVKAYRLSVEWSRLQPAPDAPLDAAELARLRDLLEHLRAAGITPMVVLHHFTNPPWISRAGGWTRATTVTAFTRFVTQLVAALRDQVRIWNTFNEPDTYASCSYLLGEFPPFHRLRLDQFHSVINHMAQAHQQACEIVHRAGSGVGPVEVGFTKNWTYFDALQPGHPLDQLMARISDTVFNRWVWRDFNRAGRNDAATFQGVNYYGRVRFHRRHSLIPARGRSRSELAKLGVYCDDMFERYPPGMEQLLLDLHRWTGRPLYITEHGSASDDEPFRIADLRANLTAVHRAIAGGADVRGFFYWSLLDNFEWQFGYAKKFGLLHVDFADASLPRVPKPIADVYHTACVENRVP
jgi:beta-glucosidase